MAKATIKVTQVKSAYGRLKNHKAGVSGLGLRRRYSLSPWHDQQGTLPGTG